VADIGDGLHPAGSRRRVRPRHFAWTALIVVAVYGLLAYIVLPALWTHYEHQKGLTHLPMVTLTGQGIPGDAINVGLIGDQRDVVCAMNAAGWYPADPITLKSSIEIIGSVVLERQYKDAPVSNLYYLGRREDLAFEKPVGNSADHRNHVRFWKVLDKGEEGRSARARETPCSQPVIVRAGLARTTVTPDSTGMRRYGHRCPVKVIMPRTL
jgi:hypothetical protein